MIHMLPNREKGTDIKKKHGEQSEEYNEWKIKKRNKKTCKENESKTEQKEAWQTTLIVHVWLCDCVHVCVFVSANEWHAEKEPNWHQVNR